MKKFIRIIGFLFVSHCGNSYSGIPVADGANLGQNVIDYVATIAEFTEQASRWAETAQHYKNELSTMSQQLQAETGIRDISLLMSDVKSIHSNISKFKLPTTKSILEGGADFLDSEAKNIFNDNVYYNRCQQRNIKIKNLCLANQLNVAKTLSDVGVIRDELTRYLEDIERLQRKAARSASIKESADIANAGAAKAAELEVIKGKLEIIRTNYELTIALQEEQEKQMQSEQANNISAIFYNQN